MILSCYKDLSTENYEKWIENRVKTFIGALPDSQSTKYLTTNTYPKLSALNHLESFISGNHTVKKELFMLIGAIAKGTQKTFISSGFADIMTFLAGHNLGPITMIDKYIFQQHPEFLKLSILRGFKKTFGNAILYLQSLRPEEASFVKLLRDKDDTAVLNRRNFDIAHTIALVIARRQTTSFDNYKITTTPFHAALEDFVEEYSSIREAQMTLAAGGHDARNMTKGEAEEFEKFSIKLMNDKFKKFENLSEITDDDDMTNFIQLVKSS